MMQNLQNFCASSFCGEWFTGQIFVNCRELVFLGKRNGYTYYLILISCVVKQPGFEAWCEILRNLNLIYFLKVGSAIERGINQWPSMHLYWPNFPISIHNNIAQSKFSTLIDQSINQSIWGEENCKIQFLITVVPIFLKMLQL